MLRKKDGEDDDLFAGELDKIYSKGLREEDILRIHILWVGNAMSRVFESGYNPNNVMTLYTAIDALHSILITKAEGDNEYKKFEEKFEKEIKDILKIAKDCAFEQKGYVFYEKLKEKYRELIKLAYKAHVEQPAVDHA